MEAEEEKALQQIVGVNVAVNVELGSATYETMWKRTLQQARITRVLGIEQPLKVSMREGFVQGALVEDITLSNTNLITIQAGNKAPEATIKVDGPPDVLSFEKTFPKGTELTAGDEMRARVARHPDPNMFQHIERDLYLLRKK